MLNAKVIFSKETKEKMEKGLNKFERGKLRFDKLKEMDEQGRLCLAHNRYEVANLVGYTEEQRLTGYRWVSNMVTNGYMSEVLLGHGTDGKPEYEYHIIKEPAYKPFAGRYGDKAIPRKSTLKATGIMAIKMPDGKTNMTIRYKELSIELGDVDYEFLTNFLIKLVKQGE